MAIINKSNYKDINKFNFINKREKSFAQFLVQWALNFLFVFGVHVSLVKWFSSSLVDCDSPLHVYYLSCAFFSDFFMRILKICILCLFIVHRTTGIFKIFTKRIRRESLLLFLSQVAPTPAWHFQLGCIRSAFLMPSDPDSQSHGTHAEISLSKPRSCQFHAKIYGNTSLVAIAFTDIGLLFRSY